ncbi:hypothetical protein [Prevotella sp.]|uniref:hypothetical protein n=1 Tax=Prevotella sp. TaxID=59823 RepID=UPI00307B28E9
MIHQKDLRLGDLVQITVDLPEYKQGDTFVVIDISEVYIGLRSPSESDCRQDLYTIRDHIEGILLTPDILEKNGWNKRHDPTSSCDIYSKGKGAFYVSLEQSIYKKQEGFEFVVADSTYRFGNKLQYVHELQHILWALGEDANLKI